MYISVDLKSFFPASTYLAYDASNLKLAIVGNIEKEASKAYLNFFLHLKFQIVGEKTEKYGY